ncbi:hypothetical protein ACIQXM_11920 [Arthrobacter sp. NPDC097144]|uniref:hypothetical protein n=1 Tax=Arthrobacter sp. NPDC097144 TaxID=3363946 RepID=UPI0038231E80
MPYMLGQGSRLRIGLGAIAGNYVLLAAPGGTPVVGVMHVQAMDGTDPWTARGLPLGFRRFLEKPARGTRFVLRENAVPDEGATVATL